MLKTLKSAAGVVYLFLLVVPLALGYAFVLAVMYGGQALSRRKPEEPDPEPPAPAP